MILSTGFDHTETEQVLQDGTQSTYLFLVACVHGKSCRRSWRGWSASWVLLYQLNIWTTLVRNGCGLFIRSARCFKAKWFYSPDSV